MLKERNLDSFFKQKFDRVDRYLEKVEIEASLKLGTHRAEATEYLNKEFGDAFGQIKIDEK